MERWRTRRTKVYRALCLALLSFAIVTIALPSTTRPLAAVPAAILQQRRFAIAQARNDAQSLLDRGQRAYEAGQFLEAATAWEAAAKEFARRSQTPGETVGAVREPPLLWIYLGQVYQDLGRWSDAETAIARAFDLLDTDLDGSRDALLARAFNARGSLQLALGQPENALDSWERAEAAYAAVGDEIGELGSRIDRAQALQTLGMYRRSRELLETTAQQLQNRPDSAVKVAGLQSLGLVLQAVNEDARAREVLQESLAVARRTGESSRLSDILTSLAHSERALDRPDAAASLYREAARVATDPIAIASAQLSLLALAVETADWAQARDLWPPLGDRLAALPPSRPSIYAKVNLSETLLQGQQNAPSAQPLLDRADYEPLARLLAQGVREARDLGDVRAESFALGQFGKLYFQGGQVDRARELTTRALALAAQVNAADLSARWQTQLGEIFKTDNDLPEAIAAYREAVATLQSLRADLVGIDPDVQFSFQESVEPVYRELVGLLLASNPSQDDLKQARDTIEALQLAELDNFFREACLDTESVEIDRIDPTAAAIYPIILRDRLEVILSIPGEPLAHYATPLTGEQVETTLDELLETLNPFFDDRDRLRLSQQVYDWLIRPARDRLDAANIKTLVFVLDGAFRNLPMSVLYDGEQYLVETYAIAVTPGFQLFAPRAISAVDLKALTGGLTEARQGFAALPAVKREVEEIASELPTKIYLDRDFTAKNLQDRIQSSSFPIVHLATHGQFSSNPEETFILTWDGKIQVREFEALLHSNRSEVLNPVELLILSACQTAAGDKRAALGLAGVAVRSGAGSTLATLWSVKDESTAELMANFYDRLGDRTVPIGKAEALRQAQLSLLKEEKYRHPFYWAPFVLVGNWL
ncbi:CHAT domain-containing protein [Oxynema aestuarii]|jgi:CHAT domain-containing protein/predicted negative regulator of RcsB-dependent stress response|uniref:CHAT domain-containing protein n=1 Tax=Oxynema aestuarii AP17 TaxID=2064643 RepID=A0A6H1U1Q5_9CYAN|nr:CHAT domain-containing protein [Oxynema aestuarii]QIZ71549.1 CHAT domain-containing protein [Oxynema aestuarii AP17]